MVQVREEVYFTKGRIIVRGKLVPQDANDDLGIDLPAGWSVVQLFEVAVYRLRGPLSELASWHGRDEAARDHFCRLIQSERGQD